VILWKVGMGELGGGGARFMTAQSGKGPKSDPTKGGGKKYLLLWGIWVVGFFGGGVFGGFFFGCVGISLDNSKQPG